MTQDLAPRLLANLERVVLGKRAVLEQVVTAFFAGGHVLLEDVPGVGKTMLGKALARSLDLPFRRLQFTADLLPADVLGVSVYDPADGSFEFKPGPIFMPVLLADELNRTPPRTQSSLLEALEDRQGHGGWGRASASGSVLRHCHPEPDRLRRHLPAARVRTWIGSCSAPDSATRTATRNARSSCANENARCSKASGRWRPSMRFWRNNVRSPKFASTTASSSTCWTWSSATRREGRIRLGASPRGSLALERAARARARVLGRDYCIPDDVKQLVVPVFAHRVLPHGASDTPRAQSARILGEMLEKIPVPA